MKLKSRPMGWIFKLSSLCFASVLSIISITALGALAQSQDDSWTEPQNLSHSGIAVNPAFVTDFSGLGHVIWQDDLGNYMYTQFNGNQWSEPKATDLNRLFNLPSPSLPAVDPLSVYTGSNPLFIATSDQFILAFWISPEGKIFSSRVRDVNFEKMAAWESGRLVTSDAGSFAVTIDAEGQLHLAYIRTVNIPGSPAGIYYTRSKDGGRIWDAPTMLYESPYLHRLSQGEGNLSITTAVTKDVLQVYVAWDNRPRKQVFLARSIDGGATWTQPVLIAGPGPESGLAGAFNIQVGAKQNKVVLVWQKSRETNGLLPTCSQIYQSSNDAGATWNKSLLMIDDLLGCGQSNKFVTGMTNNPETPLYLLTETKNQVLLTAWNGLQWSQPQVQSILSGFEEPEIYTEVNYGCRRAAMLGTRLFIVGCDQGEGGDVWVTSRDLGANTSWFQPPVWTQLSPVARDSFDIETLKLVPTDDGLFHVFFSQREDPAIYYGFWSGESWSRISPVLELPEGEATLPTIVAGPGNELLLIALSNRGTPYFSRATSGDSAAESLWSPPAQLEIGHEGKIGSLAVAQDDAGTLYIAYSVPVNEERGIYLVWSKDQGTTWSEPIQVFDGMTAGFDLIGTPSLLVSANGSLHVLWNVQSIQGDGTTEPLSMYYARSENRGQTFSDAELVEDEPSVWQEIMSDDQGNLHLLWQPEASLTTVWDKVSFDGGLTWQYPQGLPDKGKLAAVTKDAVGKLHLVSLGRGIVGHWLLEGSRWQSETSLGLPISLQQDESPVNFLTVAVNKQGEMMVVLAESRNEGETTSLSYATRKLQLPLQAETQAITSQTSVSPTSVPATSTPEHLSNPTVTSSDVAITPQNQTDQNEDNSQTSPFLIALLPVALLLFSVLAVMIRQATRSNNQ